MTMNKRDTSPAPGRITFLSGSLKGNTYPISKTTTIGREPNNDIVLAESSISRHQVQIVWGKGQWYISNVSQQNNMSINQQDVRQSPLHNNDMVNLGPEISFRFQQEAGSSIQPPVPTQSQGAQNGPRQVQSAPLPPIRTNTLQPPPARPTPTPAPIPTIAALPLSSSAPMAQANAGIQAPAAAYQSSASMPAAQPMPPQNAGEPRTQRAMSQDLVGLPGQPGVGASTTTGNATLEISTNTDREKATYPLNKQIINIGRDPSNDIVIDRPTVSAFHAQILREGTQLILLHPHPARGRTLNGLIYQGESVGGTETLSKPLARGDVFRISDEHGTFVTLSYNDGSGAPQDVLPEIRPIPLGAQLITLGRASDNTVVLDHPLISGHHARLEQVPGGYRLVDLGSTNP